jgi:hypothetical protein
MSWETRGGGWTGSRGRWPYPYVKKLRRFCLRLV